MADSLLDHWPSPLWSTGIKPHPRGLAVRLHVAKALSLSIYDEVETKVGGSATAQSPSAPVPPPPGRSGSLIDNVQFLCHPLNAAQIGGARPGLCSKPRRSKCGCAASVAPAKLHASHGSTSRQLWGIGQSICTAVVRNPPGLMKLHFLLYTMACALLVSKV